MRTATTMAVVRSVLQWIKHRKITVLMLVVTFIVSGLLVNLLQLFTLPLYWINKKLFRQLNARIVYLHWCILPWTLEVWADYDIRVYADPTHDLDEFFRRIDREHALVVLNHRGDLDWMIGWVIIDRMGMLGGTKAVMKDVAKYLPGIGWSFMFMEYPLLKRDWAKDKTRLESACKNLSDYPVNMLLCLFAEGTRFTEEKHALSMEYAKKNDLPVLKHHLFPRTKGFCFLLKNLEESLGAVYDVTICYRGEKEPSIVGVMNAESCKADICVRRFPLSEIPKDSDQAMSNWLIELFKNKDDMIEYHTKHKCFPGPAFNLPSRPWANIIVLMWICLCSIPLFLLILYLAWVGEWLVMGIIVLAIILADMLFQRIIRETETSKTSSSYGLKPVEKNGGSATKRTTNTNKTGSTGGNKGATAKGTSDKEGTGNSVGVGSNGANSTPPSKKED